MKFRVACLMGTYGRYRLATEALACFLQQTAIDDALLLVYNQHPVPLIFDHPRVRVLNEVPPPGQRLRDIRKRMMDFFSDTPVEFFHYWDDDDLYLPWHLEDCLDNIGDAKVWKPERSWFTEREGQFVLLGNRFEATWLIRADYARQHNLDDLPDFMEHPLFIRAAEARLIKATNLGDFASYIYRWGMGTQHVSGYGEGGPGQQASSIDAWRARSTDVRPDGHLIPADLGPRWSTFLRGIRDQVSPENFAEIEIRLSLAEGVSRQSSVQSGTPA